MNIICKLFDHRYRYTRSEKLSVPKSKITIYASLDIYKCTRCGKEKNRVEITENFGTWFSSYHLSPQEYSKYVERLVKDNKSAADKLNGACY